MQDELGEGGEGRLTDPFPEGFGHGPEERREAGQVT